ncbi:hypothetical protein NG99_11910 [Erwinia typographi]|uniref:Uncharacterized protein n=1 Tax=Erwinia typographi TaxID=371042 RepID=A0A0A3Z3B4_9GAMM|nr:hypothetical protein NG99_11910 [Erwinia typographi]
MFASSLAGAINISKIRYISDGYFDNFRWRFLARIHPDTIGDTPLDDTGLFGNTDFDSKTYG